VLDAPPTESEKTSWAYVAIGVLVVYATIPVARALRDAVDAKIGREAFLYLAALLVLITGIAAFLNLRKRDLPMDAYLWLFGIIGVFGIYIYQLREIPEEAIHIAEFGGLGLLVYRALSHRMRDHGIYIAAMLIVGIIGIVDEYIQWVVPTRQFDFRDIRTNFISGVLVQVAIMTGLRPSIIEGFPRARSMSRLCFVAAAGLTLLAIGFQNTPERVSWYAARHPALLFLMDSESLMAEYGYRYRDRDTGVFRSRFTLEELDQLEQQRGTEVAHILDRYIRAEGYRAFLADHSVIRDPYAHEAGVHLFRREYYIDRAREGSDRQAEYYNITYRENQILKIYFGQSIGQSIHRWNDATEQEVVNHADKSLAYDSAVSANLITRMNVWQVLLVFATVIIALLGAGWRLNKVHRTGNPA